ncbi:hypothetical protein [Microbispora sp. ATCC PTA-5024]
MFRDDWGVPHIHADNDDAASDGLGWTPEWTADPSRRSGR